METPPKSEPNKSEPITQEAKRPPSCYPAPDPDQSHSLLESAGKFADAPFWDEMMESIRRHRREMDAEWDNVE